MKIITSPEKPTQPLFATIGMFDGVHLGHRDLIGHVRACAADTGMASAVVTFRKHPRTLLRSDNPISLLTTYEERMQHLEATGVDYVILLDFTPHLAALSARDFLSLLSREYGVQGLVVGYDHRFGHNRSEGFDQYHAYGEALGMVVTAALPFYLNGETVSSSTIRYALLHGKIEQASTMLGYRYQLTGNVVEGHQLGRSIGFPTANIAIDCPEKLLPAIGVYAVMALLPDGKRCEGMMNIGCRPTVSGDGCLSVEVHLLGYNGSLYGKELTIELVAYMRGEVRYNSVDELRLHLQADATEARRILSATEHQM